jgi:hypothetical protein
MAQIRIDLLHGHDFTSKLIAWFGGGEHVSHGAGVLADGRYLDSRSDWVGAVPPGVHIRDPKLETCTRRIRATLAATQIEYDEWEANLRAKIGDAYGIGDIEDFILDRTEHVPAHYICSALQINALQHIKRVRYPLRVPAHQVSPNLLATVLDVIGAEWSDVTAAYRQGGGFKV